MTTRLKLLLTIFSLVLLYAVYYWGIPAIVNIQQRVPYIENFAKKELGMELSVVNPRLKMGLKPALWLEASEVKVVDKSTYPLFVKNAKIKINLLPLLFKSVHIAYFSCDKIDADLKIDKKHRLYIGEHLILKVSDSSISFEDAKMDIQGYKIKFKDELNKKQILLSGDYFNLAQFRSNEHIKFSTDSTLTINGKSSVINADVDFILPLKKLLDTNEIIFDGKITNLDLSELSPYIAKLTHNDIRKISGILNVEAKTDNLNLRTTRIESKMVIEKFSLLAKNNQNSLYFNDKLNILTIIEASRNILRIKKFRVLSGTINTYIEGDIQNIGSKKPFLNLSFGINKSKVQDFISLIPAVNIKGVDIDIPALKKYGLYSDIDGKILIKGSTDKPNIKGGFIFKNLYIIKPLPIPKATVNLKFIGEKIDLTVIVPISTSQKVKVAGILELYDKKRVLLHITSTKNIDLLTTQFILNPIHEIFRFELGPLPIMTLNGIGNIDLKTSGDKLHPLLNGVFNFKNTSASFNGVNSKLEKADGSLYFYNDTTKFITQKASLEGKPIKINGTCSLDGNLDFDVIANEQSLNKLLNILKTSPNLKDLQKFPAMVSATSGKLNMKLKLKGVVKKFDEFILGKTVFLSGNIKLLGNDIIIKELTMPFKNIIGNIKFDEKGVDFDLISSIDKSKIRLKGKVKDNNLYSKIKLDDFVFNYHGIPVKIFSGNMEISGDKLILSKINGLLDSMPVLVDGSVINIFKEPKFDLYLNAKPTQKFIDSYVNKKSIYPLIIKGDINYSSRLYGTKDSFDSKNEVNLQEDSSIYYMGATVGDANNPIKLYLENNVSNNVINIKNFQYNKLISSQNNKEFASPQLNAKGKIIIDNKKILLNHFLVKTQTPTDAKIFNILFKQPMIKQGQFNSNILINGEITNPNITGTANFTGIDIPVLDTTIRDIDLDFKDKYIDIKTKGEIFSNSIVFMSTMQNKLTPPYIFEDADIYLGNLDINEVMKKLNKMELESNLNKLNEQKSNITIDNFIIKKANVKAKSVFVKNVFANNLTALISLNSGKVFNVEKFNFDVAQGTVNGSFKYNLENSQTSLSLNVADVNANSISEALFDLRDQLYGSLIGQVDLTCNGATHKTCMNSLNGKGGFRVVNGRMPKLGSLEYLLKAANLVKSGVTGITLNGLIELIVPLKTGQFENINGMFSINSGIANDIQIFSKGKDLSLFLTGSYNFSNLIADMDVFGRISKKITNRLGPVGNTSLNTLFNVIPGINLDASDKTDFVRNLNKIPGFEFNDKTYRIFSAKIYGDINGEDYVQSFKWVE